MCLCWHIVHSWQKGKKEPGAYGGTAKNTDWQVQSPKWSKGDKAREAGCEDGMGSGKTGAEPRAAGLDPSLLLREQRCLSTCSSTASEKQDRCLRLAP